MFSAVQHVLLCGLSGLSGLSGLCVKGLWFVVCGLWLCGFIGLSVYRFVGLLLVCRAAD